MVELYEAAVKSYPNSEEILTQYFMAYVRVNDYQKQQQVMYLFTAVYTVNGEHILYICSNES